MKIEKYIPLIGSVLLLVYAIFLWYMIPYYVLCTTDEVFYASIADSFVATGLFIPTPFTVPAHPIENVKFYGFVYFSLVGNIVQLFGNELIVYRSVSYFFMWACLGISYLFIRKEKIPLTLHYWFIALFVTDQMFTNIVMTGAGRMNSLALFLLLSSIYVFHYEVFKDKNGLLNTIFSAFLLLGALLTTPRILVFLPIFFVLSLIKYYEANKLENSKQIKNNILWQFIVLTLFSGFLYAVWILQTFNTFLEFYAYFFKQKLFMQGKIKTMQEGYTLGGGIGLNNYYLSIIFILCLSSFAFYKQYQQKLFLKSYILLGTSITVLILFIMLQNMYTINLLPFIYLILFLLLRPVYANYSKIFNITLGLLFTMNLGILGYKTLKNVLFIDLKNEQKVTNIIKTSIPSNSNVIASEIYYYPAIKNQLNYQIQYVGYYYSPEERLQFHLEKFNPEYLILSNKLNAKQRKNLELYGQYYTLTPYKEIRMADSVSIFQQKVRKLFSYLGQQDAPSYDGMIYKMTRK